MDTLQLKLFLSLSKTLNFTKTANEFYVTQPTVSNYIKSLENNVGVTLLKRDSHNVSLTPEGEEFVMYATQILALQSEAEDRLRVVSGGRSGYLRVAVLTSAMELFSLCLEECIQKYPGMQVNVNVLEGMEMVAAANQCSYDIYFAHQHMVSDNDAVEYFVTGVSNMELVFHRSMADQINMSDWSSLQHMRFVAPLDPSFSLAGQIRRICANRGLEPNIINYYNRADVVLMAVNANVGLSILPPQLVSFYNWPNVAAFPIEGNDAMVYSVVCWNKNSENPDVKKFLGLSRMLKLRERKNLFA